MISYTFLLLCKNEEKNMTALLPIFRSWKHSPGQNFAVNKLKLTKK
jgi:hypothetical protein